MANSNVKMGMFGADAYNNRKNAEELRRLGQEFAAFAVKLATLKNGMDGRDGEDGQDSFVPGPQGIQGIPGSAGQTIVGQDGEDGPLGPPGPPGSSIIGPGGVMGPAGMDGEDGQDAACMALPGTPGVGYTDLNWPGGYVQTLGNWTRIDAAAGLAAVAMDYNGFSGIYGSIYMLRAGSVLGICVRSNVARTAGTLTVEVAIDGVGCGLTAVLDAGSPQTTLTIQAKDLDTFTAMQQIGVLLTTAVAWAPVTADIKVSVLIEC
jgi:hypothetical protein